MIDTSNPDLSIRQQCAILGLCRSRLYYTPREESSENLELMRLMDKHHLLHPYKGCRRMRRFLLKKGYKVNVKRVRRLMQVMGIEAHYAKPNLSRLGSRKYVYPYLLSKLNIERPNQVWQIDLTYIPMKSGYMYLVAIIDVYSRMVVSWGLSNSMLADFPLAVLSDAIAMHGCPEILNSDQGSQFTCEKWVDALEENDIHISMDGKGRATDNAYIERLWRTVKEEYVYLHPSEDGKALFDGLKEYFEYYNFERDHQGIDGQAPIQMYQKLQKAA